MATYYIDYEAADDSANGTTTGTPWKRHPYMQSFGGAYGHAAGDQFIFKGGVTWPNAAFPMDIVAGGSGEGTRDYYGVDAAWYIGGAWARPIFDLEDAETTGTNRVFSFANGLSYVTVDNFELTGFYWTGATVYGEDTMFKYGNGTYFTFKNIYVHDFSHGVGETTDDVYIFSGNSSAPYGTGCIIEDCICDGSLTGDCVYFNYGGCPIIRNNVVHDVPNGIQSIGVSLADHLCYGNEIYNIDGSFDATNHENALVFGGPGRCYNNIIHDCPDGMGLYPSPGWGGDGTEDQYIYNNIIWGYAGATPINIDPEWQNITGTVYVVNNTVLGGGSGTCLGTTSRAYTLASLVIQNNHWITSLGDPTTTTDNILSVTEDHNLIQTEATANGEGYVEGNEYAPTANGNGTVNVGANNAGLFTTDINGVSRPQGIAWDDGAYEYYGGIDDPVPPAEGPFAANIVILI